MRQGKRHRAVAASIALAAAVGLSACAPPAEVPIAGPTPIDRAFPDETQAQLEDAVTHAMAAAGASGAVVGVWAPWSGTWVTGLGTQQMGGGAEITDDMRFRAARLTRPMVCDVLYDLVDSDTVALADSVTDYVPGVPDLSDVTLDDLCDSTSGVGSFADRLQGIWIGNPTRRWDPREQVSYGLAKPRASAPGATYVDADTNYVLLGLALERATGRSLSDLIASHVTVPLGLAATQLPSLGTTAVASDAPVLTGHHSLPDGAGELDCAEPVDRTQLSASVGYGDTGVVSDIHDVGKYVRALAVGALQKEGAERFDNVMPAYAGAPTWYTADGGALHAGALVGQTGSTLGYAVSAWSDPNSGLTVAVVLNNSASGGNLVTALAWELAAIASKAPAAPGATLPEAGLPWTAEQYHDAVTQGAICPIPAP
ncbi:serine hydrolase domain-containing protein [Microbacterium sp. BWT-B31]|uniref:serine hydrolase domain-containing protein n=1 Tax=Microbacterium sp. BWT-B31 TaxID=3232072 RepID=UPI003529056E